MTAHPPRIYITPEHVDGTDYWDNGSWTTTEGGMPYVPEGKLERATIALYAIDVLLEEAGYSLDGEMRSTVNKAIAEAQQ